MRRKRVIGQGFPVRKHGVTEVRRKKRHFFHEALGIGGVGCDDGQQLARGFFALAKTCQKQRIGRSNGACEAKALAGEKFGKIHAQASGDDAEEGAEF